MVGSENRLKLISGNLVEPFENRIATIEGKAMVVCMSRRICIGLALSHSSEERMSKGGHRS